MGHRFDVFEHSLDGSTVLPILSDRLPECIALHRKISKAGRTEGSHLFATFPDDVSQESLPELFAIAFIDRSARPETEMFFYLSSQNSGKTDDNAQSQAAILAILAKAARLPVAAPLSVDSTSRHLAHIANTSLMLGGALEEKVAQSIDLLGLLNPLLPNLSISYSEYVFRKAGLPTTTQTDLPDELCWGRLSKREHYQLVISRTEIPRQIATLSSVPSIAVLERATGDPVAWSFLVTGSMSTLHVEEAWRGRGIAKLMAAKCVRMGMDIHEDQYGYAHVALDNTPSRRVCESIGGRVQSRVYWLRVDLSKVLLKMTG